MWGVPTGRAELMLESLVALLEAREMEPAIKVEVTDEADATGNPTIRLREKAPGGLFPVVLRSPVVRRSKIHIHDGAKTGRITVQNDAGERESSLSLRKF